MRKAYASQASVETTLTAAERAAPFAIGPEDDEPLTGPTRESIIVIDGEALTAAVVEHRDGQRRLVIREKLA